MRTASIGDYRNAARRRLPPFLFEYIDGGAFAETTLHRNALALEGIALRQRVLRDVARIDVAATLFGRRQALPVVLGPVGLAGMYARRGEVQSVRAATAADVPFCLSAVSICPLAEVAAAATRPFWFQLYMIRDRALCADLLDRARATGCTALVFTVDMPVPGTRYRDYRSGLAGQPGWRGALRRGWQGATHPRWALDVGLRGRPHALGNVAAALQGRTGLEDFMGWMRGNFDATVTWRDLAWVRERWTGPLIVKGIMDVDDAREVVAAGADGLVVSNHGGRQLDGVPATAAALPAIAAAVGDRLTVLADGGVRSGLDVVKLLALGARGVLLGRAWAYALAANGEAGVAHMLRLIEAEMRVAMALTGCTDVDAITPDILIPPG